MKNRIEKNTASLQTIERQVKLPAEFSSVPGRIDVHDLKVPEPEKNELKRKLVQNIFRHTSLMDKDGKIICPTGYATAGATMQESLAPSEPPHLSETSVGTLLFMQDAPILGITADYLRLTSGMEPVLDNDHITWGAVVGSLFQEYDFYDSNGNKIEPSQVCSVNNNLFESKPEANDALVQSGSEVSACLGNYLANFFAFDFENGRAKVKNPEDLQVNLGSAQRGVTPFCFGNCAEGCRFCYVDRRLSTLKYPSPWFRKPDEISEVLAQYNPDTKKGPPQMRMAMMDWEPTEHADFLDILHAIAERDPNNQIPIVTHGGSLTTEFLEKIASDPVLKKLVLFQVSLNSANPERRAFLMAGHGVNPNHHENAINSLPKMHELGLSFDVSIVATTNWIPIEDIEQSIIHADKYAPHSYIRVALPTATKDHPRSMLLTPDELTGIDARIVAMRDKVKTPIILTVGLLNRKGLGVQIEGVMPESAGAFANISHGARILSINGIEPRSRTEATLQLLDIWRKQMRGEQVSAVTTFWSQGQVKEVDLCDFPQKSPRLSGKKPIGIFGLLIHDDIDFGYFEIAHKLQEEHKIESPLVITSNVMLPFVEEALPKLKPSEQINNMQVMAAENKFFGGNVCIAGLLTFTDILAALKDQGLENTDGIFIPDSMISRAGYDLQGYHYRDLAHAIGVPVFPVKSRTGSV